MNVVNEKVIEEISSGKSIKINLGCGTGIKDGYFGLDMIEHPNVDINANLNEPFELLPDNCVDEIWCSHVLEHVENITGLMQEIYRISTPDAKIQIRVPHFSNPYFYSDPTHIRFFGLYSMYYFTSEDKQPANRKVPAFYTDCRFDVCSIKIHFLNNKLIDRLLFPKKWYIVNKSFTWQDFYERRLCRFFPASYIEYIIKPEKLPV